MSHEYIGVVKAFNGSENVYISLDPISGNVEIQGNTNVGTQNITLNTESSGDFLNFSLKQDGDEYIFIDSNPLNSTHVLTGYQASTTSVNNIATFKSVTDGDMQDGFGSSIIFSIEDNSAISNTISTISSIRNGADNTGKIVLSIVNSGINQDTVEISNNQVELISGSEITFNGVSTLSATTLGPNVVDSSLTTVGNLTGLTVESFGNFNRTVPNTGGMWATCLYNAVSTADMVDGFGPSIVFTIEDNISSQNTIGTISTVRNGSDNTGKMSMNVYDSGVSQTMVTITPTAFDLRNSTDLSWGNDPNLLIFGDSSTGLIIQTPSGTPLIYRVNAVEQLRMDSSGLNIASGNEYYINGVSVLNSSTLGPNIVDSSLNTVGNLTGLTVESFITANRSTTSTTGILTVLDIIATSTNDMSDSFGPGIFLSIGDNGVGAQPIGSISGVRSGADNSGKLEFRTYSSGVASVRLSLDGSVATLGGTNNSQLRFREDSVTRLDYTNGSSLIYDVLDSEIHQFRVSNSAILEIDSGGLNIVTGSISIGGNTVLTSSELTIGLATIDNIEIDGTTISSINGQDLTLASQGGDIFMENLRFFNGTVTTTAGSLTIGAFTDIVSLSVASGLFFSGLVGTATGTTSMEYNTSTGEVSYQVSSQRFKKDIKELGEDSKYIYELRPVSFVPKTGQQVRKHGFLAEEVFLIKPDLVPLDAYGLPVSVRYSDIVADLVSEVQKLKQDLDSRKKIHTFTVVTSQRRSVIKFKRNLVPADIITVSPQGFFGSGYATTEGDQIIVNVRTDGVYNIVLIEGL